MAAISINLLRWSTSWSDLKPCIDAVLRSDFKDFAFTYTENWHESAPSLVEVVRMHFGSDPRLHIVKHDNNLGYAGAHNQFFATDTSDLLMVLNPDAILERSFIRNILAAFSDPQVGAATGKMVKPSEVGNGFRVIDGTGIELLRTRRARERGQLEQDHNQYDTDRKIFGVSGTAAVYRKTALESVKLGDAEYFDTDFFAYCEDVDLSWRMRLKGFRCAYVPEAIVEHTRAVGVSAGGLKNFSSFVKHRRSFPASVRQLSWRNHLFAIVKNDFGWPFYRDLPRIVLREIGMLFFIVVFSPETLLSLPVLVRLLPRMLRKRRHIQTSRTVDAKAAGLFFS